MSSDPSTECHEEQLMKKQASEEKEEMMMVGDDGLYPVQDQSGEDEVNKGSLGVTVNEEDVMLAGIETDLIFSDDAFPSLPDFPCLSSPSNAACPSSSSSSNSSSSSATSATWAFNRQKYHQHRHAEGQASSSVVGDISMTHPSNSSKRRDLLGPMDSDSSMYQLAGLDLLGSTDESWDPLSLFPDDGGTHDFSENEAIFLEREELIQQHILEEGDKVGEKGEDCTSEELAMVFLEWLRDNKEIISPQDLRSIKLKRSTIESAARSLGGGKDGMKKLLKLILNWVQNNHLQKKRHPFSPSPDLFNAEEDPEIVYLYQQTQAPEINQPPIISDLHEGHVQISCEATPYAVPSSTIQPFSPQPSVCSWQQQLPQYAISFPTSPHPLPSVYNHYGSGHLFHQSPGESFLRLASSATKEARKKRMARQRRFSSLHHSHNHQHSHHQRNQQPTPALSGEGVFSQMGNHGSWTFRPSSSPSAQQVVMNGADTATTMAQQRQQDFPLGHAHEKRQGWKTEKNLRFLLQKVLKQSDVGSLGRIVLPKKEAETHLPELETRDGISLVMEDIATSRTWNMRYRFWPNNKSRMYLLENTGDFVRSNGLQEGDFIVIYSDTKCGKYMIRGVKVRQSTDTSMSGNNSIKNAGNG